MTDSHPRVGFFASPHARRGLDRLLLVAAVANLAAGVAMSLSPDRGTDFASVTAWSRAWMAGGDVYRATTSSVDYPPWALVVLAPVAWLPTAIARAVWIFLNAGMVTALVWRLVHAVDESGTVRWRLACLIAATAGVRSLNGFTLAADLLTVFGVLAMSASTGGVMAGLGAFKPQVGGVAILWSLFRGDWIRAASAVAVPLGLTVVYAARVGARPWSIVGEYIRTLQSVYPAPQVYQGHTEILAWTVRLWPSSFGGVGPTLVLVAALLTPLLLLWPRRREVFNGHPLELLACCGVVSLLAARHKSSDLILLAPALVAWRSGVFRSGRLADAARPAWAFWGLAVLLVAELPSWVRLAGREGLPLTHLDWVLELDWVVCLAVWAMLIWGFWRVSSDTAAPERA